MSRSGWFRFTALSQDGSGRIPGEAGTAWGDQRYPRDAFTPIDPYKQSGPDRDDEFLLLVSRSLRSYVVLTAVGYLFVWIDVDVTLDALLPHVGPGVAAHPLPLTLGALVLSKASLLALVGGQSFTFRPCLNRNDK